MSWLSNLVGAGDNGQTNWYEDSNYIQPAFQVGAQLVGGLTKPDPVVPYPQTEAYADKQMAFEQQKFAYEQQLNAQKLALEASKAKGAGAGAAAAIYAAKLNAAVGIAGLKNKTAADAIAMRIQNNWGKPDIQQGYGAQLVNAIQNKGAAAQSGFNSAANFLSGARR